MKKIVTLSIVLLVLISSIFMLTSHHHKEPQTEKSQLLEGWYDDNNNIDSLNAIAYDLVVAGRDIPGVEDSMPVDLINLLDAYNNDPTLEIKIAAISYMKRNPEFAQNVQNSDAWDLYQHFFNRNY